MTTDHHQKFSPIETMQLIERNKYVNKENKCVELLTTK